MIDIDYHQMTVKDLKEKLKERGCPRTGNKADLISRLEANDLRRSLIDRDIPTPLGGPGDCTRYNRSKLAAELRSKPYNCVISRDQAKSLDYLLAVRQKKQACRTRKRASTKSQYRQKMFDAIAKKGCEAPYSSIPTRKLKEYLRACDVLGVVPFQE